MILLSIYIDIFLFLIFQNNSPTTFSIDNLGIYLLISLFFVVATIIEFAVVLLVKRNSGCTGIRRQKVSGNKSNEKMTPQELYRTKITTRTNKIFTEQSITNNGLPEEMLYGDNSLFNAPEQHENWKFRVLDFDAGLNSSMSFLPSSNAIDIAACVLFPIVYLAFNIWYMLFFCSK